MAQYLLKARETVPGTGVRHPLYVRGNRIEYYTIIINEYDGIEYASAEIRPIDLDVVNGKRHYHGNLEYIISEEEAAPIFNAGLGGWLTLIEE